MLSPNAPIEAGMRSATSSSAEYAVDVYVIVVADKIIDKEMPAQIERF